MENKDCGSTFENWLAEDALKDLENFLYTTAEVLNCLEKKTVSVLDMKRLIERVDDHRKIILSHVLRENKNDSH